MPHFFVCLIVAFTSALGGLAATSIATAQREGFPDPDTGADHDPHRVLQRLHVRQRTMSRFLPPLA